MAQDKAFRRIEAKLDALLEAQGIDPDEIDTTGDVADRAAARQERKLTPQEQDAINNAPTPKPDLRNVDPAKTEADLMQEAGNVPPAPPAETTDLSGETEGTDAPVETEQAPTLPGQAEGTGQAEEAPRTTSKKGRSATRDVNWNS